MHGRTFQRFRSWPHALTTMLALGVIALTGCSEKSSTPPPGGGGPATTTTLIGAMINGSENGALTVTLSTTTLAPPAGARVLRTTVVNASATYRKVGGGTINLSGTYDTDTDSLHLSGSGYTIAALVEATSTPPSMVGEYNGPNGIGFFGAISNEGGAISAFCGTYQSGSTAEAGTSCS